MKKTNGTKDAISRYSNLKMKFDTDLFNNNWVEVDTKKTSTKSVDINYIDLFI